MWVCVCSWEREWKNYVCCACVCVKERESVCWGSRRQNLLKLISARAIFWFGASLSTKMRLYNHFFSSLSPSSISWILPLIVLFVLLTLTYCSNERKKGKLFCLSSLWKAILTTKTKRKTTKNIFFFLKRHVENFLSIDNQSWWQSYQRNIALKKSI